MNGPYIVYPIGRVESPLVDRVEAPQQGDEGAPDAWLVFDAEVRAGLAGLADGADILVLTWLHRASRDVLVVHPRDDTARPLQGVFSTRSPARPNPVGLHRVTVLEADGLRLHVRGLEAVNGTPIVDVKPVLGELEGR